MLKQQMQALQRCRGLLSESHLDTVTQHLPASLARNVTWRMLQFNTFSRHRMERQICENTAEPRIGKGPFDRDWKRTCVMSDWFC